MGQRRTAVNVPQPLTPTPPGVTDQQHNEYRFDVLNLIRREHANFKKQIAERLKKFRIAKGLTQRKAAEILHFNHATIAEIEAGRRSVRAEELWFFGKAYGVSMKAMVGDLWGEGNI